MVVKNPSPPKKKMMLTEKGSSEFLMIMVLMLAASIILYQSKVQTLLRDNANKNKTSFLHLMAQSIRDNAISNINNNANWIFTQKNQDYDLETLNDGVFSCLVAKSCSHAAPGLSFILYNHIEQIISNPFDNRQGYTLNGDVCNTFDATNGNDDCPFRYENMRWYADCLNEPNPALCQDPKINIRADLLFKPASQRFKSIPFNSDRYTLDYTRTPLFKSSTVFTSVTVAPTPGNTGVVTVPPGAKKMSIEIWGAGGGGAGGGFSVLDPQGSDPKKEMYLAGGGGGGGAYVRRIFSVSDMSTYSYTVGKGGVAGTNSGLGASGGDTVFKVFNADGGLNFILTAGGGSGGENCVGWPCNNTNGNGLGGFGGDGKAVTDTGVLDTLAVINSGKKGEKYNSVHDKYHFPKSTDVKLMILYYGGRGGAAGGGGGSGGSPNQTDKDVTYTLPMSPGGGGAGTQYTSTVHPQNGADGMVVIWFSY